MPHYSLKSSIPTESLSKGLYCTNENLYFSSNTFLYSVKDGEYSICGILENNIKQFLYINCLLYVITENSLVIIYESKNIASLKCTPSCFIVSKKFIILGSENSLEIWFTPKEYKFGMFDLYSKSKLHNDIITCIMFYNDDVIVSGSKDCSVKLFYFKNKKIENFFNTKSIPVKIFKIEKHVIAVCEEGQIYYVNFETRKIDYKIFKNTIISCADQFENLICICCWEDNKTKIEIICDREVIYSLNTSYEIFNISFKKNRLAFRGKKVVGIYNYEIDTFLWTLDLPKISCLDISNDLYVVGCTDKKVRLYDDKKNLKIFYDEKNTYPLLDVYFLSGSILSLSVNGHISLFDIKNGICFRSFDIPLKISATAICDDGMMLFIANFDNYKIKVIDLQRSKEIESLEGHEAPVKKLIYSNNFLFSLSTDNEIKKWDIYKSDFTTLTLEKLAINFVVRSKKIFIIFNTEIVTYDFNLEYVSSLSFKYFKPAQYLDLSFDGKMLFLSGEFNKLIILDTSINAIEQTVKVSRNVNWKNYKDKLYKNQKESCDKSEIIECIKLIHSKNQYKFTYLSREGVFTYNWSISKYLPLTIDLEATREALDSYIENKKYLNALIVSLKLNDIESLKKIELLVPDYEVSAIAKLIPGNMVEKFRIFLINQISDNFQILKSYEWMRNLIFYHGRGLYDQKICKKTGELGYKSTLENIFLLENLLE